MYKACLLTSDILIKGEEKVINAKVQIVRVIAGLSKTNLKSQNPMLVHGGTILFIQGTELLSPISAIPVAPQISDSLHTDSLHTESLHTDSPHTDPLQSVADELAHGCTIVVQNERTATATTLQGETLTEPHHMSLADFVFTVLARISSDSDSARIRYVTKSNNNHDKILSLGLLSIAMLFFSFVIASDFFLTDFEDMKMTRLKTIKY